MVQEAIAMQLAAKSFNKQIQICAEFQYENRGTLGLFRNNKMSTVCECFRFSYQSSHCRYFIADTHWLADTSSKFGVNKRLSF